MVLRRERNRISALLGMRLGFIGSGRVASVLAQAWAAEGYRVTAVSSRGRRSSRMLAGLITGCQAQRTSQAVVEQADLVFLTVPDDAIAPLAASLRWRPGVAVVHCSGSLASDALQSPAIAGALVGTFHPLQTFANRETVEPCLRGTAIAIDGDARLTPVLEELARAVGGRPFRLPPQSKALYHASATLVCASVAALLQQAAALWGTFGYSLDEALVALQPLLQGTVRAMEGARPAHVVTGPIARGDVGTIRRHMEALEQLAPDVLPLYGELGLRTIPLAREQGSLNEHQARQLHSLLMSAAIRREKTCV